MHKGETVVAKRDLGGVFQESVPAGSKGIVVDVGGGNCTVMFTVPGFPINRKVEILVDIDDVM